ncbi:major tail protein [Ligilactobacillus sp. LYQ139]|uniref:major tail protein n=1 Tax=Ligilactobacillus sp. LYQ139 TaxID=3378800 RepID=UPI003853F162
MAYIGLNSWMIARIDPNTKKVITDANAGGLTGNVANYPGVFNVTLNDAGGATQANISNLQGTVTKTYGSNAVARAAAGTPEPTVALGANGLPFDVLQRITGMKPDGKGGYIRSTDPEVNHCALLICTTDWDGAERFIGFYDGTVTMGNTNIQTNNQSERITADTLTYTALGVDSQVGQPATTGSTITSVGAGGKVQTIQTGNSVKVYHMWSAAAKGFDRKAMMDEIFASATTTTTAATTTTTSSSTETAH